MISEIKYISAELPIDSKNPKSCLYWIYLEGDHTDPKTSGYIGVSIKGADERFKSHLRVAKRGSSNIVHKAIRKYGKAIKYKELIVADSEFCLLAEEMFRPVPEMKGTWNLSKGGIAGRLGTKQPDSVKEHLSKLWSGDKCRLFGKKGIDHPVFGTKTSEKSKAIRREACKNNTFTEDARQRAVAYTKSLNPWEKQAARRNSLAWSLAQKFQELVSEGLSQRKAALKLEISVGSFYTIIKKIKAGWNPSEDLAYLSWLSEYNKTKETENVAQTSPSP